MKKDNEMRIARVLYVEQGKTAKEIADMLDVSEKTLSTWVNAYNWKALREAKQSAPDMCIVNIKDLLQQLAEERMMIDARTDLDEHKKSKEKARIADEISKWTKSLETANRESIIPLATYLKVMERIFDSLREKHPKIYLELIDFQEQHILQIAQQYQ